MSPQLLLLLSALSGFTALAPWPSQPMSAVQVLARSIEAHGGNALTRWKTLVIRGEVQQKDNRLWFRGEHIVYAQKPDKLRAETDLTRFERGRFFYSEILNGGKGWMIQNLLPSYREEYAKRYRARLDRCDGVALYRGAESLTLSGEDAIEGKVVYVLDAVLAGEAARLYIDKDTFYLVREVYGDTTWAYSDFQKFGEAVRASRIVQTTTTGSRAVEMRYTYRSIELDVPIDPAIFEEDMPK